MKNRNRLLIGLCCLLPLVAMTETLHAQMNYQGRLTDAQGNAINDGQYNIEFRLFNTSTLGTELWGPFTAANVDVVAGRFNTIIGATDTASRALTTALASPTIFLQIKVGGNAPLTPRQQILSAPKALHAAKANHATTADTAANFTSGVLKTDEINKRVGIGTPTPRYPLSIMPSGGDLIDLGGWTYGTGGGDHFGFGISGFGELQIHTPINSNDIVFGWGRSAAMNETMRIKGTGRVGIGTASPLASLQVNSATTPSAIISGAGLPASLDLRSSNSALGGNGSWRFAATIPLFVDDFGDPTATQAGGGDLIISPVNSAGTQGTTAMTLMRDGKVGIGTSTPLAPLHVTGAVFPTYRLQATLEATGASDQPNNFRSDRPFSIISEQNVRALAFDVNSDERIKNILAQSDSAADLKSLMNIQVTDYKFKDALANGTTPQKKVIAQQVEAVFPQAVSQSKNSVPDIYQKASIEGAWVTLASDLKVGERVRLVGEQAESIHEVLEIADGRFRTDFTSEGDEIFVYGREVNDFRTVDYDAIAMLNVSATQQIKKEKDAEVAALKEEIAELRERVSALDSMVQARDLKFSHLEKRLDALAPPVSRTVSMKSGDSAR